MSFNNVLSNFAANICQDTFVYYSYNNIQITNFNIQFSSSWLWIKMKMSRVCVFLAAVVAVTLAEQCADFASFNIQVLGTRKVGKSAVVESLTKVIIIISRISVLKIMEYRQ